MRTGLGLCLAFSLLVGAVADAEGGRRTLRIDGGDWEISDCSATGISWLGLVGDDADLTVRWGGVGGHTFEALETAVILDAYCQESVFLDEKSFSSDEAGLAELVGPNTNGEIYGVRQSLLRIARFDAQVIGYGGHQWAFYFFPGDIVIVALYGLQDVEGNDLREGSVRINGGQYRDSNYQGEYFCFRNGEFMGTWDGEPVGSDPRDACPLPDDIFRDGFE